MIIEKIKLYRIAEFTSGLSTLSIENVLQVTNGNHTYYKTQMQHGLEFCDIPQDWYVNPLDAIAEIDQRNEKFMNDASMQLSEINTYISGVYRQVLGG